MLADLQITVDVGAGEQRDLIELLTQGDIAFDRAGIAQDSCIVAVHRSFASMDRGASLVAQRATLREDHTLPLCADGAASGVDDRSRTAVDTDAAAGPSGAAGDDRPAMIDDRAAGAKHDAGCIAGDIASCVVCDRSGATKDLDAKAVLAGTGDGRVAVGDRSPLNQHHANGLAADAATGIVVDLAASPSDVDTPVARTDFTAAIVDGAAVVQQDAISVAPDGCACRVVDGRTAHGLHAEAATGLLDRAVIVERAVVVDEHRVGEVDPRIDQQGGVIAGNVVDHHWVATQCRVVRNHQRATDHLGADPAVCIGTPQNQGAIANLAQTVAQAAIDQAAVDGGADAGIGVDRGVAATGRAQCQGAAGEHIAIAGELQGVEALRADHTDDPCGAAEMGHRASPVAVGGRAVIGPGCIGACPVADASGAPNAAAGDGVGAIPELNALAGGEHGEIDLAGVGRIHRMAGHREAST
ncbi:hypothetical protein D3C81_632590 [compost metagenome]